MLNLLNAANPDKTVFWLLVCLGVLFLIEIVIFAVMLVSDRRRQGERRLVGITLDTQIVQREFEVGEEFDCTGLIVQAAYNLEPTSESVSDYIVLSEEHFEEVKSQGELNACYVVKPDMYQAGKTAVTVIYQDKIARYSVAINGSSVAAPVNHVSAEESEIVATEVEHSDSTVTYVNHVTDTHSKKKVRLPESILLNLVLVKREFKVGDEFNCKGLRICAKYRYEPMYEGIVHYTVVDQEKYNNITSVGIPADCYIVKPELNEAGTKTVTVAYRGKAEYYTITVSK